MARFYNIYFDNLKQRQRLRYQIADTPVTAIWLKHVEKHLNEGYQIPPEVQWFYTLSSVEKINNSWLQLQHICSLINDAKLLDHCLELLSFNDYIDPAQKLNQLHFEFHNSKETNQRHSTNGLLQLFNIEIHRLESLLLNKEDGSKNSIAGCFYLENHNIPNVDITQYLNLVDHWNYQCKHGDLLLGYHTIGKNLYHCWINNDIDLVKKQMTRPQDNISTETIMQFFRLNSPTESVDIKKKNMLKWLVDNDLLHYVDMENPWHWVVGHPLLGENLDNLSFDDACKIFEIGNVVSVELD